MFDLIQNCKLIYSFIETYKFLNFEILLPEFLLLISILSLLFLKPKGQKSYNY